MKMVALERNKRIGAPFLGRLPIDPEIARVCDAGGVEDHSAGVFVSLSQDLVSRTPEARYYGFVQVSTVRQEPVGEGATGSRR